MSVLPASLRVAVWATAAYAGRLAVDDVAQRAMPDLDHCVGLTETLSLWHDLGEHAVLVALPRPGDISGLPPASAEFTDAAVDAEEAVYVPGLGGALVPQIERFGPDGDHGWQARWTAYDTEPVPIHRVQAVDLPDVELQLRRDVAALTDDLAGVPGGPMVGHGLERVVRDHLGEDWGMPEGVSPRALRVIELAGSITALSGSGLDHRLQSVDSAGTLHRERILQQLRDTASAALVAAANATVVQLAGWR